MTRARNPDPVASELTSYFLSGEADQGLSSSWGPLASIALGGFGGSPDPERRLDQRFRLGPAARTPIARARETRATLARIDTGLVLALWAAYGPIPWAKNLDQSFGRGMSIKVQKRLGDLAPVALLTPELGALFKAAPPPPEAKPCWRGIGGFLVALCLDEEGKARAAKVKKAAEKLLAQAREAYAAARRAGEGERPKKPARATSGDRRRTAVESEEA